MKRRSHRLEDEVAAVDLGDARLNERARSILGRIEAAPSDSFPEQMQTIAEREALYRFLNNEAVTLNGLLEAHVQQTHERMAKHPVVRVVHDTTEFSFEGEREGLGVTQKDSRGFYAHVALAVGADEGREPFGVLGVRTHLHQHAVARRGMTSSQETTAIRRIKRSEKLSSRWEALAIDVSSRLPAGVQAVHVMDQEADDYVLWATLQRAKLHFVVRVSPQRRLENPYGLRLAQNLSEQSPRAFRTVTVNARTAKAARTHPARKEREAELIVRWGSVTIKRTQYAQAEEPELHLYAVHVVEPNPPEGEAAIEWMLLTSEAVASLEDATTIVDHYRARWIIEEYFKALKTGCAFEKRQLTTLDGLLRALGLFIPAAWKLLALRNLGRAPKPRPASHLLAAETLLLLRAMLEERRYSLPASPTVRDAMLGVAALGGHIKGNGDPGWLVLGRGFLRLVEAEVGWRLARRSDQS
jgi:transposase-like protein/DDE family transposase